MLLVYLDPYHLGDPLFLPRFALSVKAHRGPLVLLHGGGEAAERALEARGRLVERVEGVLQVDGVAERALVERAARDLNRRVVDALNEAGVAALRVSGTDRGLLREGASGELFTGRVAWLRGVVEQGAVPVVVLLAERAGEGVEASPGRALATLAAAFATAGAEPVAVMLSRRRGGTGAGLVGALAAPEVARAVAASGVRVRVAPPAALQGEGVPEGVDLPSSGA